MLTSHSIQPTFLKLSVGLLFVAILIGSAGLVEARSVLRSSESVSVAQDDVVNGDFYSSAQTITVSGSVAGDMVAAAVQQIRINGTIADDLTVAASEVNVFGTVGDDMRVAAGSVVVAEAVQGDLVVLAGTLEILSTATVTGDVIFYGGDATIAGSVGGSIFGSSETLRIDGAVAGPVDVTTNQLVLGESANLQSNVRYVSPVALQRASGAVTASDPQRTEPPLPSAVVSVRTVAMTGLALLFSVLLWHLLFRGNLQRTVLSSHAHPLYSILLGLGVLLATPAIGAIVLVTMIGSLVGLLLLLLYGVLVIVSLIAAGAVAGSWVVKYVAPKARIDTLWQTVGGTILLVAALFVPLVGPIGLMTVYLLTLGTLVEQAYRSLRGQSLIVVERVAQNDQKKPDATTEKSATPSDADSNSETKT